MDLLYECAVVAGGFEAIKSELRGYIFGGQFAAAQARATAFEEIVREKLHVRTNLFRVDRAFGRFHSGRNRLSGS